jgi:hypothetical protein
MSQRRHPSHSPHSIPWIIVSRLIGLAIFFIIVVVLQNIQSSNPIIQSIIAFLTTPATIALVVIFSLLFLVGEVFLALDFPLSLPGPFFNALGSIFLVSFLFQLLYLVDQISDITIFTLFRPLEPLLYLLVFFIVLIVQYVHLFSYRQNEPQTTASISGSAEETPDKESAPDSSRNHDWEEVEAEFRMLLYDFFHTLRDVLKKKE